MSDQPHVFTGISRQTFERMRADLRARGVSVPDGDSVHIRHMGVTGSLEYSEPEGRVTIEVLEKPFFVSSGTVASMLDQVMRQYESG